MPRPFAKLKASLAGTFSGIRPLFFQPSISPASCRAGQRFSSSRSAWMSCLMSRIWSSVSRMVKLGERPTSSAWRRKMRMPMEWNVPSQGMPSTAPPTSWPTRSFISRAALFVKVTARISFGRARCVHRMCAMRVVSTRVLPVPRPPEREPGRQAARQPRVFGVQPLR